MIIMVDINNLEITKWCSHWTQRQRYRDWSAKIRE